MMVVTFMRQNWKLRKDAFAQLEALFKAAAGPEEPIFATYGECANGFKLWSITQ